MRDGDEAMAEAALKHKLTAQPLHHRIAPTSLLAACSSSLQPERQGGRGARGSRSAGVLVNGEGSQGNSILANSIYSNDADGIVLRGGANAGQPAPQNVDATKADNTIRLSGAVSGDSGEIRVQVFASPAGQSGGVGGRSYLDEFLLTGPGPFVRNVPAGTVAPGDVITLTATPTATSDTSQFSAPATIR